ncbi:hypothetical protein SpCBS45565_g08502 [Spizellomyces sp. 'palustris']|nr:hypothetical protein SpCBS45565_g08502 [Spizellomyces sp. 'palustris']
MKEEEEIMGVIDKVGQGIDLEDVLQKIKDQKMVIEVPIEVYEVIIGTLKSHEEMDAQVNTKYKTVDKKIGHTFMEEMMKKLQLNCDGFLTEMEERALRDMLVWRGKVFLSSLEEIGCMDPGVVLPMVIFMVPHVPWNLKPLPVPRAILPELISLLQEKEQAKIIEPSSAPYVNQWFTVKKKNGKLRFIQDLQPMNQWSIRDLGSGQC